ncbi:MAG: GNAT family N-acetyltransferase [Clostridia bacterium]|jgi:GNAT superfamily N-acetyltransferase|nr:GNAT family N-acetyltransferase [Clostridia bacterium]
MIEIRLAQAGDISSQKEIWKRCFGDPDSFIDLYYAQKYRADETMLLLEDGVIAAMLTMLPVTATSSKNTSLEAAMLYAVATHPHYQKKGFAGKILAFTGEYLKENHKPYSVLVPATGRLFDFYRNYGYQESFSLREAIFPPGQLHLFPKQQAGNVRAYPATPRQYNEIRESLLEGLLHISYPEEVIAYQQLVAQYTGGNIYLLTCGSALGCAAVERHSADKIALKDFLCPAELELPFLRQLSEVFPAREYFLRTPAASFTALPGQVCPFAMSKQHAEAPLKLGACADGYLGLALD